MWESDHKEGWALKNWCSKIQPVHPKGNQSWIFFGRTDTEVEVPVLWPPAAKNWLIWKDPDTGKDRRQEEKGMTEDETVGSHPQLDGHESEQALGVGDVIQPSHPLSSPSPPTFNLSQNQGLFKWVSSSHQVAKVLEFWLQHQSFQRIFRTDFL